MECNARARTAECFGVVRLSANPKEPASYSIIPSLHTLNEVFYSGGRYVTFLNNEPAGDVLLGRLFLIVSGGVLLKLPQLLDQIWKANRSRRWILDILLNGIQLRSETQLLIVKASISLDKTSWDVPVDV